MQQLPENIEELVGLILDHALALAAIATLSMALLELVKALISARRRYHEHAVGKWIADSPSAADARRQLLLLAAGGAEGAAALYNQATEKMMGQIQAAMTLALDFPHRYPALYAFATAAAEPTAQTHPAESWKALCERIEKEGPIQEPSAADRAATQSRSLLEQLVARKLDSFQITTEFRWARINQALSIFIAVGLLLWMLPGEGLTFSRFALAVAGSLLAPFAKDVVSALSGIKVRRA